MASAESTSRSVPALDPGYALAPGVQVRGEDFGLLFYNRRGPRLFFLSCGDGLTAEFFNSGLGLAAWLKKTNRQRLDLAALGRALARLAHKGVLIAD